MSSYSAHVNMKLNAAPSQILGYTATTEEVVLQKYNWLFMQIYHVITGDEYVPYGPLSKKY